MALPCPQHPLVDVYDAAYTGRPNWEIGRPQPAFVALEEAGLVRSPVLDLGCGTGELALFLAGRGHDVLGIDLSTVAIRQARRKATERRIPANFLVLDALDLPQLRERGFSFRTVVDSAMFHVLGDRERTRLIRGLGTVVRPGGLYCVLGDARRDDRPGYGITPGEIERRFERVGGWELVFAYRTAFQRRWSDSPAYLIGVRRL